MKKLPLVSSLKANFDNCAIEHHTFESLSFEKNSFLTKIVEDSKESLVTLEDMITLRKNDFEGKNVKADFLNFDGKTVGKEKTEMVKIRSNPNLKNYEADGNSGDLEKKDSFNLTERERNMSSMWVSSNGSCGLLSSFTQSAKSNNIEFKKKDKPNMMKTLEEKPCYETSETRLKLKSLIGKFKESQILDSLDHCKLFNCKEKSENEFYEQELNSVIEDELLEDEINIREEQGIFKVRNMNFLGSNSSSNIKSHPSKVTKKAINRDKKK